MSKQAAAPDDATLAEARERVLVEAARFRAKLPELLRLYAGRWVVFREDEVASVHATEEEAYLAGLARFGPYGGQVVAAVQEPEVVVLNGLTALGL